MRRTAITILILAACAFRLSYVHWKMESQSHRSWNPQSRVLDWGLGSVTIPPGFDYEPATGIDSFVGTFRSQDGRIRIHHDIGELAGEHGTSANTVSFPCDGCAIFRIEAESQDAVIQTAAAIRSGFQSGSRLPAWLRNWLPRWGRLDCRVSTLYELFVGPEAQPTA